jgi:AcrR family transcriptional regulator
MASKRQKTTSIDPRARVVDAALAMAARRDWANVSMADIARTAKMSMAEVSQLFERREDILVAYGRRVDRDVLERFSSSGSERDQIFDIMMERFERLNQDRAGLTSILAGACRDPKQMVISFPSIASSMTWMLEACGIETTGLKGALRVAGLSGVYIWVLRTWREDESADLSKTMAALDRVLGRAESVAGTIGL